MADLTPELLEELEARAKAATPGPWTTTPPPVDRADGFSLGVKIGATRGGTIYATPPGGQYPLADAKHIAAASPDVVLALVEAARERDQLIGERFAMRGEIEELRTLVANLTRRAK